LNSVARRRANPSNVRQPFTEAPVTDQTDRVVKPLFLADWRNAIFIHFSIAPYLLQPFVPLDLDLHDNRAFVSLVAFTQQHLRPSRGGRIAELLARPLASHEFLNLRTYVRHGDARGIYFLSEWIPNRLAAFIGPRTYGLPYRLGKLSYAFDLQHGTFDATVESGGAMKFRGSIEPGSLWQPARANSLDAFLLERYRAFTSRRGSVRRFEVAHDPWLLKRLSVHIPDMSLVLEVAPWFGHLQIERAHVSPRVQNVRISGPRIVKPSIFSA
jgi:uncharacterized protein YqjF (DUF2071 family)